MEGKGRIGEFFEQIRKAVAGVQLSADEQQEYSISQQRRLIFNLRFFSIAVLTVLLVFSYIDYYRILDNSIYRQMVITRFVLIIGFIIPFLIYTFSTNSNKRPHLLLSVNVVGYIIFFLVQSYISKDYSVALFHNTMAIFLLNICIYFILGIRISYSFILSIFILFTINFNFHWLIVGKTISFSYSDMNFWFIVTTVVAALASLSIENILKKSFKVNRDLKMANQSKYKLFSLVSHDLKNMISAQYSIADLLKDDHYKQDEANRNRMIDILHHSSQDVLNLFEDLMSWIKTQIEVLKPEMQTIDMDLFHQSVLNQMIPAAESKNIQLLLKTDTTNEIQSDPHILGLIIRNLLGNAIKYSKPDSIIEIKNFHKDGYVEYHIIDTGVGMSEQQLQHIFNFQTIHSATGTKGEKGTGLGLLMTKEMLQVLNGSIQIVSSPEMGTSVTFKVPSKYDYQLEQQVKAKKFNRWLLN